MNHLHQIPRPSAELQVLTFLNSRMRLTSKDRNRLHSLTKGFVGELKFFYLLEGRQTSKSMNLFDLRLEVDQNECQIDSLLIFQDAVCLIEVKNFDGDFSIEQDKWVAVRSNSVIDNPLRQLERSERLLQRFFRQNGMNPRVESFLVFVHPEFVLYQAPYVEQVIFPGQLARFVERLNGMSDRLARGHQQVKDILVRQHVGDSTHAKFPDYDYRGLRRDVFCGVCGGVLADVNRATVMCSSCGATESRDDAILRNIYEFSVLFPRERISVNTIYDWLGKRVSTRTIRRVLMQEMKLVSQGKYTHYLFNEIRSDFQLPLLYQDAREKILRYHKSLVSK